MKRTFFILLVINGFFIFSSCRLSKDLAYFQDLEKEQSMYGIPEKVPEYRIRAFDNLYVNILTLDPEVNQLFNPNQGGNSYYSSTQQMYGGLTSQYINGYLVESDGTITFPIIGTIPVSGLTLIEAQNRIKEKALEYLKEPIIKVKILSFKINVTGEVRNPGLYYNYQGKLTVLEAVSMAGGITNYARIKKVLVIRQGKFNTQTYILDLTKKNVFESEAFYLQPDDLVYVSPGRFKDTGLNTPLASTAISAVSALATILVAINLYR